MTQPRIGITVDSESGGGYSRYPWLALRQNYADAVTRAGGLALLLPPEPDHAGRYLDLVDGIVVSGGNFDVDPSLFGDATRHPLVRTKDRRTAFELAMVRGALERDTPILGICGGQQLLHVALGGRLIQHIPDEVAHALLHEQLNPRHEPSHEVRIVDGTRLRAIVDVERFSVNSAHHQAAADQPAGVKVCAFATDGVIEAIEAPSRRFCIGVQWHPEFLIDPADVRLFDAFIAAAAERA